MTVTHRHGGEEFHTHSDEEYAAHAAMTDEIADSEAVAMYAGHTKPDAPAMVQREDTPRSLAEEEAAVQDTPAAVALRQDQAQGYQGQDAADAAGGIEELRDDLGAKKDGPGAPDYPPGHPNDPTVPPSAGSTTTADSGTATDGATATDATAGTETTGGSGTT